MKKWVVRATLVLLLAGALIAGPLINFGLPFGYYGELNRLTAALKSIPGVSIEKVGSNADVTLEEISFWIEDGHGRRQIHFGENDPVRKLSGQQLQSAVAARLSE